MSHKTISSLALVLLALGTWASVSLGAEKLTLATPIKGSPVYYLLFMAAEEKGFWKEKGLAVEWVPFKNTATLHQAVAGATINLGLDGTLAHITLQARAIPTLMISALHLSIATAVWVPVDGPIKKPEDLKGKKLAVTSFGGQGHVLALLMVKALGLEKDVKFVAIRDIPAQAAALERGLVDGLPGFYFTWLPLKAKGKVRPVADLEKLMPGEWLSHVAFVRKPFLETNPELVDRVVKGLLLSTRFLTANRPWAVERMMKEGGIPQAGAEEMYEATKFSSDGRISKKALENSRNILIEYGLSPKDSTPAVDELYTRRFTG